MTISLNATNEEFAAKRRGEQDALVERLSGVIGAAFSTGDIGDLKKALTSMYHEVYDAEIGDSDRSPQGDLGRFMKKVDALLEKANPESSVERTALALANALLNDATASAYKGQDGVEFEWVSMEDENVRETHVAANGQRQPAGEKFSVGESKMYYPGDLAAPIEEWINCRCALKPVAFSLTASADVTDDTVCIMAIPAEGESVHQIGPEEKHATLIYFGDLPRTDESDDGAIDAIKAWTAQIAADGKPFTATVKKIGDLGHDDAPAKVWLLDSEDLHGIHEGLMSNDMVRQTYEDADTTKYDEYTPHVTIGYPPTAEQMPGEYDPDSVVTDETLDAAGPVEEIAFDRLAVWHGSDRSEYPLGEPMTTAVEAEPIADEDIETPADADAPEVPVDERIPWHGVLAPNNTRSGDGRAFTNLGRTRDLPLPLTWQEVTDDGHKTSITVAMIEKIEMIDDLMEASGHFLSSVEEADEVIGLISEFGKFGVSVDADDIGAASFDEDTKTDTYDDPRICSASIVVIPAFPEAYVAIGPHPVLDADPANGDAPEVSQRETDEDVAASSAPLLHLAGVPESFKQAAIAKFNAEQQAADEWAEFADVAPGKTEDGPGWLTHPVDTDRLRDYWVRGPGAAKIAWGTPGDFNRCRVNVAEYVKPQYLNGYCANRHYDALKSWPGQNHGGEAIELSAEERTKLEATLNKEMAPALTLIASGGVGWSAPSGFFAEPTADECSPEDGVCFSDDGARTFGYIAEWGVCHIGYDGMCKEAPPSASNYSYFSTGVVNTPDGPVKVGSLTAATGHANPRLKAMPAAAHYDDTGSAWAYVVVGENDRGIWFSGMVKPGVDPTLLNDVAASGRISGDWRPIGNDLELVAGLTVNVPGFPIVKPHAAASEQGQLSLVAAGIPGVKKAGEQATQVATLEQGTMSLIASLVVDEMEARNARRARLDAIKAEVKN